MAITERERLALVHSLEGAVGEEAATTLMEYLPVSGWRDVARVSDLEALEIKLTGKIDGCLGEIGRLEGKIDGFAGRIDGFDGKIDGVQGRLEAKIESVKSEIQQEMTRQTRTLIVAIVMMLASNATMLVGLSQLLKP